MNRPYPPPLNEQDYETLSQACKSCHGTAELINDCLDCGLPFEDRQERNAAQAQLANALRNKFFPHVS